MYVHLKRSIYFCIMLQIVAMYILHLALNLRNVRNLHHTEYGNNNKCRLFRQSCKRYNIKLHHLYHLSRDKYWK